MHLQFSQEYVVKFNMCSNLSVLNRVSHMGLVGQTRGSFSWVKLVGYSGGSNLWVKLVGHCHWSFLFIHCYWACLCLDLLGSGDTLRSQNCPTILVIVQILAIFNENSNIYNLLYAFLFFPIFQYFYFFFRDAGIRPTLKTKDYK